MTIRQIAAVLLLGTVSVTIALRELTDHKRLEISPPAARERLSPVVDFYNDKVDSADVDKMPIVQSWRYDGRNWSDGIDQRIYVR